MVSNKSVYEPLCSKYRNLLSDALEIEAECVLDAGRVGYMARALTLATIPHRDPKTTYFERENGLFKIRITDNIGHGLPYGSYPRLLLMWMTTEALLTKSRTLYLGEGINDFMRKLGLRTDGTTGRLLKNQAARLFGAVITCVVDETENSVMPIAPESSLGRWWCPNTSKLDADSGMILTLDERFYNEIITSPIPIDERIIAVLKQSPMALDINTWLTYRVSYLRDTATIGWDQLQLQFGAGYAYDKRGKENFRRAFKKHLKSVLVLYPGAKVEFMRGRLVLQPSATQVPKL